MKTYQLSALAVLMSCAATAAFGQTFTYVKTINLTTPAVSNHRFTAATTDGAGGVYYTSSSTDGIYYLPDPVNSDTITTVTTAPSFGSGNSHAGATWDGTKVYTGGKTTATDSQFWEAIPNASPATSWTTSNNLVTGTPYSGPAAVAQNKIVVANDANGSLSFLTDTGAGFTVDNATAISGGGAGAKSLAYDNVGGKIYEAASGASKTADIYVFNSNGTAAGTTAGSVYVAGTATTLADSQQGIRYQSIAIDPASRLLAFAKNTGTSGTTGYAVYSLVSNSQVQFIDLTGTPENGLTGVSGSPGEQAQGVTFLNKGGKVYLALGSGSASTSKVHIFQGPNSAVADWSIY